MAGGGGSAAVQSSSGATEFSSPAALQAARQTLRARFGGLEGWLAPVVAADPERAEQLAALRVAERWRVPLYQTTALFDLDFVRAPPDQDGGGRGGSGGLFGECAAVLGLHPDEATEPIVDCCLAAAKPFAVVPCCVFADSNPHRRLADGSAVRSVEQYVAYLAAKDRRVQVGTVAGMPGRNVVVYCFDYSGDP